MKKLLTSLMLLLAFACWCAPEAEARVDREKTKQAQKMKRPKRVAAGTPVAKALAEAGYFTETTALPKAKFYIFICSASWCGPCRQLMPKVVEEYENNMKKDKTVSMVLLGADKDEASALEYISHYNTDMPGVLNSAVQLENRPQIPGVPWFFILNAKGELVSSGAGSKVLNWKEEIKKQPQKSANAESSNRRERNVNRRGRGRNR